MNPCFKDLCFCLTASVDCTALQIGLVSVPSAGQSQSYPQHPLMERSRWQT
jgi:hypothetical protein